MDIFKYDFTEEKFCVMFQISLKIVQLQKS